MPVQIVSHSPALLRLLKVLNQTVGRDKLTRIVQYATRFLAYYAGTRRALDVSRLLSSVSLNLSFIRKSLRILKPLNHLANVDKQLAAKNQDVVSRFLGAAKDATFVVYLFFDNIIFLKQLKVMSAKSFPNAQKISATFWAVALAFGVAADVKNYVASHWAIQEKSKKHIQGKADYDNINALEAARYRAGRRFVWDSLDLLIALNASKYLKTNEGAVALAGVVTSVLGIQDVWAAAK